MHENITINNSKNNYQDKYIESKSTKFTFAMLTVMFVIFLNDFCGQFWSGFRTVLLAYGYLVFLV